MRLRNGGKGEALPSLFPRFAPNAHTASFNVLFKKTVEVNNTIWIIAYILGFINFYI
jgi:hypothetical protein